MNIVTLVKNGVRTIRLNKPEKKNALSTPDYKLLGNILNEDAQNDDAVATVITGTGNYFSSGNDILGMETNHEAVNNLTNNVKELVDAMINYPKILIAVVNGPAIGIGATLLGLCDVAYASDRATFQAPFVKVGLNAKLCSSFTFPRLMGRSKASELIFLGEKINADDAYRCGLVSKIFPHNELDKILEDIQEFGKLSVRTVKINKKLIMDNLRPTLLECNKRECEALKVTFLSDEFKSVMEEFMTRKKNST